jgi:hypothetical protein
LSIHITLTRLSAQVILRASDFCCYFTRTKSYAHLLVHVQCATSHHAGNTTAKELADKAAALVPPSALQEFVWRRQRNFAVSLALLKLGTAQAYAFLCITLDDNALFGANIAEALQLQEATRSLGLGDIVNFHPGADEVALVMLARAAVLFEQRTQRMRVAVLWRLPSPQDQNRVPDFEGQPLNTSMHQQLEAASVSSVLLYSSALQCGVDFDWLLVMNNFDEQPSQLEASAQNFSLPTSQFDALAPSVLAAAASGACPVALGDVRYANGADVPFVTWLLTFPAASLPGHSIAYAGWNTAGNSLGTAIANGVLNSLYATAPGASLATQTAATYFTMLRLMEDNTYQARVRQELIKYVEANGDSPNDLRPHLLAYELFVQQPVQQLVLSLNAHYELTNELQLLGVFFPWNRTFEIGFQVA